MLFFHTDDEEEDAEESNFERTSSNSPKKDSSTHLFCFKNRQERASLRGKTCITINGQLSLGCLGYLIVIPYQLLKE